MSIRKSLLLLSLSIACVASAQKFVGGDISLLPEYINANATYYDSKGQSVTSPLQLFKDEGMNACASFRQPKPIYWQRQRP